MEYCELSDLSASLLSCEDTSTLVNSSFNQTITAKPILKTSTYRIFEGEEVTPDKNQSESKQSFTSNNLSLYQTQNNNYNQSDSTDEDIDNEVKPSLTAGSKFMFIKDFERKEIEEQEMDIYIQQESNHNQHIVFKGQLVLDNPSSDSWVSFVVKPSLGASQLVCRPMSGVLFTNQSQTVSITYYK